MELGSYPPMFHFPPNLITSCFLALRKWRLTDIEHRDVTKLDFGGEGGPGDSSLSPMGANSQLFNHLFRSTEVKGMYVCVLVHVKRSRGQC